MLLNYILKYNNTYILCFIWMVRPEYHDNTDGIPKDVLNEYTYWAVTILKYMFYYVMDIILLLAFPKAFYIPWQTCSFEHHLDFTGTTNSATLQLLLIGYPYTNIHHCL